MFNTFLIRISMNLNRKSLRQNQDLAKRWKNQFFNTCLIRIWIEKNPSPKPRSCQKPYENTPKGKHNWKWFVFHFRWFSYILDFSHKQRQSAKRREHLSAAQWTFQCLWCVLRKKNSEHTSKKFGGPSSRWHVHKWQGVRGCIEQMTCP